MVGLRCRLWTGRMGQRAALGVSTSLNMAKKTKKSEEVERDGHGDDDEDDDEEDEDNDDEEGEDSDDEDDEALNLGTADSSEPLQMDFGFYDPKPSDFHGIRALVANGSLMPEGTSWDVGGLADTLCEQVEVGSVAKTIAEGSEEPADDEVLGFMSAVNMHAHRSARFAQELRASLVKRCPDALTRKQLAERLDDARSAVIVSERMVNLPAALVPSLVDALLKDLTWASEHAEGAENRDSFRVTTLLLVASANLRADAPSEGGPSSSGVGGDSAHGTSGAEVPQGGKKKKRKREADAASTHAALFETVEFARVEEELLAASASWHVVLNGAGRARQVVLAMSPSSIEQAIPALHAAMGEDA